MDDLDPAAAFLAREHEQLGELEEEIGSLSGASSCCALRSFCFQKTFSSWFSVNGGHCWISGELSWSWLGLEESERSESQLCLPSHCISFRSSVANSSHPSSDKHLDVFAMISMSVPLLVRQEPAVIREWREKQVRLDQPGRNGKIFSFCLVLRR